MFGTYLDENYIKDIRRLGVPNTQYNKFHPLYCTTILPLIKISKRLNTFYSPKIF